MRFLNKYMVLGLLCLQLFVQKSMAQSVEVYTFRDEKVMLSADSLPALIVIVNLPACINCYKQIAQFAARDSVKNHINLYLVINDTAGLYSRKNKQQVTKSFFVNPEIFYTSPQHAPATDSAFLKKELLDYAPSAIVLKNGKEIYLDYHSLFPNLALNETVIYSALADH